MLGKVWLLLVSYKFHCNLAQLRSASIVNPCTLETEIRAFLVGVKLNETFYSLHLQTVLKPWAALDSQKSKKGEEIRIKYRFGGSIHVTNLQISHDLQPFFCHINNALPILQIQASTGNKA